MTPQELAQAMEDALLERGWERHDIAEAPPGPLLILRDKRMRVLRSWTIPDDSDDFPQLPGLYVHLVEGSMPVVLNHTRTGEWVNVADGTTLTGLEVRRLLPMERLVPWDLAVDQVLETARDSGLLTEGLAAAIRDAMHEGKGE